MKIPRLIQQGFHIIQIRVWAAPDAKASGQLDYANEVAGSIFDELETLYGIPYDLYKLGKAGVIIQ